MFGHSQDKEVFRDNSFNKVNNIPMLSTKTQRHPERTDAEAREAEVFNRLPSIPLILEQDKTREEIRVSPPYTVNSDVSYESEGTSHLIMRSSMYTLPGDEDLFELVGLPMILTVQPFNHSVPVPEYRTEYLSRCKECGSFPTVSHMVNTEVYEYTCTMCSAVNSIQGDSPSLYEYTTDFVCEGESKERSWYSSNNLPKSDISLPSCRKWKEPSLVFLVDCSSASRNTAGYAEFIHALKSVLLSEELSLLYKRFSIVLAGESVCVVSDGEMGHSTNVIHNIKGDYGLCAPLFIETDNLTEETVNSLLETVENCSFSGSFKVVGSLTACIQLAAYTGGSKVISWFGSASYSDLPERLTQTAVDCGVSLHIFSTKETKLNNLYKTIFTTGGSIERESVYAGVLEKVQEESFFRCSIRVVCSNGLKKRAVYSSGCSENISMISFPEMSPSTTFSMSFSVDDFLKEGAPVYIQTIVEYVNLAGENRVRVLNMKLRATRVIQQIFSGLSMDSMFCGICKYICSEPMNIQENIKKAETAMISALTLYKRACAKDTSPTQLVLPDSIKGLPVLLHSILKYPRIQLGGQVRVEVAGEIMPLPVDRTFRIFYPRLVKISSLFTVSRIDDLFGERLSMRALNDDEGYLLDAGAKCILWFGRGAVDYMEEMAQSEVVTAAIERLKELYGVEVRVNTSVQGSLDAEFIGYMIEDQMGGYPKYQEYLGFLHGKILKK